VSFRAIFGGTSHTGPERVAVLCRECIVFPLYVYRKSLPSLSVNTSKDTGGRAVSRTLFVLFYRERESFGVLGRGVLSIVTQAF
jgi:hypothetical protein